MKEAKKLALSLPNAMRGPSSPAAPRDNRSNGIFRDLLALAMLLFVAPSGAAAQVFLASVVPNGGTGPGHVRPWNSVYAYPNPASAAGDESRIGPKTFVDMTPAEVGRAIPELKHLEPANDQEMLPQILEKVGAAVATFFDNFSNTTCTERILSVANTPFELGAYHYDNKYSYVALGEPGAGKGRLKEFRTGVNGEPLAPDSKTGVVTFGFVAMSVHFYPEYQSDSRFRYLGREWMEGQDTYVVAFAQRPGVARQTASVQFLGHTGVVFMQGVAWIHPQDFHILRLRTDIEQPELNVGLLKESTEILYSEVSFQQGGNKFWLPREVNVSGQLKEFSFRNQHRYSDYRLFKVEVGQKPGQP